MIGLCAGVDISVARVDVALIPFDDDHPLADHAHVAHRRRGDYPAWSDRTWYRAAVRDLLADTPAGEVVLVGIEKPPSAKGKMSDSTFGSLHAAFGAIAASVPAGLVGHDYLLTPYEWRAALAPRRPKARSVAREHLNKEGGHALVRAALAAAGVAADIAVRLEHNELDSLGVALALRKLEHARTAAHRHTPTTQEVTTP